MPLALPREARTLFGSSLCLGLRTPGLQPLWGSRVDAVGWGCDIPVERRAATWLGSEAAGCRGWAPSAVPAGAATGRSAPAPRTAPRLPLAVPQSRAHRPPQLRPPLRHRGPGGSVHIKSGADGRRQVSELRSVPVRAARTVSRDSASTALQPAPCAR